MKLMAQWIMGNFTKCPAINPSVHSYLKNSYPSNHNYLISTKALVPSPQLAKRVNAITLLYPNQLTSLLDLSVCKGYFAFKAAQDSACGRVLGLDLYQPYIDVCEAVNQYLSIKKIKFANMSLQDLAQQYIGRYGGPFQTVLMINCYQYFYFGGDLSDNCYLDHERIFADIRAVCNGRLIFNNRTELADCQNLGHVRKCLEEQAKNYTEEKILLAAEKFFKLTYESTLGKYPLWILEAI